MPRGQGSEPLVVCVAENGSVHAPITRTLAHRAPGILHLAVSLQVVDPVRELWLLQRRAGAKALFANRWANTCCTHPAPGEDPASAAIRRVGEEIGLVVTDLVAAGSFTYRATDGHSGLVEHEHDCVFVAVVDTRTAEPDPEEVSELALLPFEEADGLVRSEAGAPWAVHVLRRSQAALSRARPPATRGGNGRAREKGDRR